MAENLSPGQKNVAAGLGNTDGVTFDSKTPLADISGAYTKIGNDFGALANNAAENVGARQRALIGNDLGGVNNYMYNTYYGPEQSEFKSGMRVEGANAALNEGLKRGLEGAKSRASSAQQNYNNVVKDAQDRAAKQMQLVYANGPKTSLGQGNSEAELANYEQMRGMSEDEIKARITSQANDRSGIVKDWQIKDLRKEASQAVADKFGMTLEEVRAKGDDFWSRGDVSNLWTYTYAKAYRREMYGQETADNYEKNYQYNMEQASKVYKAVHDNLDGLDNISLLVDSITKDDSAKAKEFKFDKLTYNTVVGQTPDKVDLGIEGNKISVEEAYKKGLISDEKYNKFVNELENFNNNNKFNPTESLVDGNLQTDYKTSDMAKLNEAYADMQKEVAASDFAAATGDASFIQKEVKIIGDGLEDQFEAAFGVDYNSAKSFQKLYNENRDMYNSVLDGYSHAMGMTETFEYADGKTEYYTPDGYKVLEEGTPIMWTFNGAQNDEDLKKFLEYYNKATNAYVNGKEGLSEEEEAQMMEHFKNYQKHMVGVTSLSLQTDNGISTPAMYGSVLYNLDPEKYKDVEIYDGKTADQILEQWRNAEQQWEIADFNPWQTTDFYKEFSNLVSIAYGENTTTEAISVEDNGDITTTPDKTAWGERTVESGESPMGLTNNMTQDQALATVMILTKAMDEGKMEKEWIRAGSGNNFYGRAVRGTAESIMDGLSMPFDAAKFLFSMAGAAGKAGAMAIKGEDVDYWELVNETAAPMMSPDEIANNVISVAQGHGIQDVWTLKDTFEKLPYDENYYRHYFNTMEMRYENLRKITNPYVMAAWGMGDTEYKAKQMREGNFVDTIGNFAGDLTGFVAGIAASNVAGGLIANSKAATAFTGAYTKAMSKGVRVATTPVKAVYKATRKMTVSAAKNLLNAAEVTAYKIVERNALRSGEALLDVMKNSNKGTRLVSQSVDDVLGMGDDIARETGKLGQLATEADSLKAANDMNKLTSGAKLTKAEEAVDKFRKAGRALKEAGYADELGDTTMDNLARLSKAGKAVRENVTLGVEKTSEAVTAFKKEVSKITAKITQLFDANKFGDAYAKEIFSSKEFAKNFSLKALSKEDQAAVKQFVKQFGAEQGWRSTQMAYIHSVTGESIEKLSQLSTSALNTLSNINMVRSGNTLWGSGINAFAKSDLKNMSDDAFKAFQQGFVEKSLGFARRGKAVTGDTFVSYMVSQGFTGQRAISEAKKYVLDFLEDIPRDMYFSYKKPDYVSNINQEAHFQDLGEYLTDPSNYIFNGVAAGLQLAGGKALARLKYNSADTKLRKARAALETARATGAPTEQQTKLVEKVMRYAGKAQDAADDCLIAGLPYDKVQEKTSKVEALTEKALDDLFGGDSMLGNTWKAVDPESYNQAMATGDVKTAAAYANAYNASFTKANADYVKNKKGIGGDDTSSFANSIDESTNIAAMKAADDARVKYMSTPEFQAAKQKISETGSFDEAMELNRKVHDKMKKAMISYLDGKGYTSVESGVDYYFNALNDLCAKNCKNGYWGVDGFRYGYIPLGSMTDTNHDMNDNMRGFSRGTSQSASPSLNTMDPTMPRNVFNQADVINAAMRGEKEISYGFVKDADGNMIPVLLDSNNRPISEDWTPIADQSKYVLEKDDSGEIIKQTREIDRAGFNIFDNLTYANNSNIMHTEGIGKLLGLSNAASVANAGTHNGKIIVQDTNAATAKATVNKKMYTKMNDKLREKALKRAKDAGEKLQTKAQKIESIKNVDKAAADSYNSLKARQKTNIAKMEMLEKSREQRANYVIGKALGLKEDSPELKARVQRAAKGVQADVESYKKNPDVFNDRFKDKQTYKKAWTSDDKKTTGYVVVERHSDYENLISEIATGKRPMGDAIVMRAIDDDLATIVDKDGKTVKNTSYAVAQHQRKANEISNGVADEGKYEKNDKLAGHVNHSGGAIGSDSVWGDIGADYGVKSNHYYYKNKTPKGNVAITKAQFEEGKAKVLEANKTLGRKNPEKYMNLLARNWQQVKNADTVFAVGKIKGSQVDGGTGWAVQMAIDSGKPVYVFDQNTNKWHMWNNGNFIETETPTLTKNFAGIGTREISETGKKAIRNVYEKTIGNEISEIQGKTGKTYTRPTLRGVRTYDGDITPDENTVFVFGSNPEGRHGAGAAKIAKEKFGAIYGQGEGLQGNSYAIPTKDLRVKENKGLRSISPEQITQSISKMYETAKANPDKKFKVAYRSDNNLNGYSLKEMADMFKNAGKAPDNVEFSSEMGQILNGFKRLDRKAELEEGLKQFGNNFKKDIKYTGPDGKEHSLEVVMDKMKIVNNGEMNYDAASHCKYAAIKIVSRMIDDDVESSPLLRDMVNTAHQNVMAELKDSSGMESVGFAEYLSLLDKELPDRDLVKTFVSGNGLGKTLSIYQNVGMSRAEMTDILNRLLLADPDNVELQNAVAYYKYISTEAVNNNYGAGDFKAGGKVDSDDVDFDSEDSSVSRSSNLLNPEVEEDIADKYTRVAERTALQSDVSKVISGELNAADLNYNHVLRPAAFELAYDIPNIKEGLRKFITRTVIVNAATDFELTGMKLTSFKANCIAIANRIAPKDPSNASRYIFQALTGKLDDAGYKELKRLTEFANSFKKMNDAIAGFDPMTKELKKTLAKAKLDTSVEVPSPEFGIKNNAIKGAKALNDVLTSIVVGNKKGIINSDGWDAISDFRNKLSSNMTEAGFVRKRLEDVYGSLERTIEKEIKNAKKGAIKEGSILSRIDIDKPILPQLGIYNTGSYEMSGNKSASVSSALLHRASNRSSVVMGLSDVSDASYSTEVQQAMSDMLNSGDRTKAFSIISDPDIELINKAQTSTLAGRCEQLLSVMRTLRDSGELSGSYPLMSEISSIADLENRLSKDFFKSTGKWDYRNMSTMNTQIEGLFASATRVSDDAGQDAKSNIMKMKNGKNAQDIFAPVAADYKDPGSFYDSGWDNNARFTSPTDIPDWNGISELQPGWKVLTREELETKYQDYVYDESKPYVYDDLNNAETAGRWMEGIEEGEEYFLAAPQDVVSPDQVADNLSVDDEQMRDAEIEAFKNYKSETANEPDMEKVNKNLMRHDALLEWASMTPEDVDEAKAKMVADNAKIKSEIDKIENTKFENADGTKTSIKDIDGLDEKYIEKYLNESDYNRYKKNLENIKAADDYLDAGTATQIYVDPATGMRYINDGQMIDGMARVNDILTSTNFTPIEDADKEAEFIKSKENKKASKKMQKEMNKGKLFEERRKGILDVADMDYESKKATYQNWKSIADEAIKQQSNDGLNYDNVYIADDYADFMQRITSSNTDPSGTHKIVNSILDACQWFQQQQLAGGAAGVNALSMNQIRDAMMQNPSMIPKIVKMALNMKDNSSTANFTLNNLDFFSEFAIVTGDNSILADLGQAISSRPGISDGGDFQRLLNVKKNFKEDVANRKASLEKELGKKKGVRAYKEVLMDDIDSIFSDKTFQNVIPVLKAQQVLTNYDAARKYLLKNMEFTDDDALRKAAMELAYVRTRAFWNPYDVYTGVGSQFSSAMKGEGFTANTFSGILAGAKEANAQKLASEFNGSSQSKTILDVMTNFFFALRYKMMLSGRGASGFASMGNYTLDGKRIKSAKKAAGGKLDYTSANIDMLGTQFSRKGSINMFRSMALLAGVAAASCAANGLPTAWEDFNIIGDDGEFQVPDILKKFQTVYQIYLPGVDYKNSRGPVIDVMSSTYTLQNSVFKALDRSLNSDAYYAAPQRGLGFLSNIAGMDTNSGILGAINGVVNNSVVRGVSDEIIGSNLISPLKATYELITNSSYYGNNIWEKKYLADGRENPNYDPMRNIQAGVFHITGLDNYGDLRTNAFVKGKDTPGYVAQDQVGTVGGAGILQHEYVSGIITMMSDGDYLDAVAEMGELPIKFVNKSSQARTSFNTTVKNNCIRYMEEYKKEIENAKTANDKDAAYATAVKKCADLFANWSKKYDYVLGENQELVAATTRTMMAICAGEYDDITSYVQNAYRKASDIAQITQGQSLFLDLSKNDDGTYVSLEAEEMYKSGKTEQEIADEATRRSNAYDEALLSEYEARKALLEAGFNPEYMAGYADEDFRAKLYQLNKKTHTEVMRALESPVEGYNNYMEMKKAYEARIEDTKNVATKKKLASEYNTYVTDLLALYVEKYGPEVINDTYYMRKNFANNVGDYIIIPYGEYYKDSKSGKTKAGASYLRDLFGIGYKNGSNLQSDEEVYKALNATLQQLSKGNVASANAIAKQTIEKINKGQVYASNEDLSKLININANASARSK